MRAKNKKKCAIQWIDKSGKPTPDENDAIGYVYVEKHEYILHGEVKVRKRSESFPICANHVLRLPIAHWKFYPYHTKEQS